VRVVALAQYLRITSSESNGPMWGLFWDNKECELSADGEQHARLEARGAIASDGTGGLLRNGCKPDGRRYGEDLPGQGSRILSNPGVSY
jgi:hypothetical protein